MPQFTIQKGRPTAAEAQGRLPKELNTYDLLDRLAIPYLRVDHPALYTIEDCQGVDRILGIPICKNLFLTNSQKTEFYLLLLPGQKKYQASLLSRQLGTSRLSFAGPEHLKAMLDLTPGSVSVMGLMNDPDHRVHLVIDRQVADQEFLACHPCVNTSSLKLRTKDLLERFLPATGHVPAIVTL